MPALLGIFVLASASMEQETTRADAALMNSPLDAGEQVKAFRQPSGVDTILLRAHRQLPEENSSCADSDVRDFGDVIVPRRQPGNQTRRITGLPTI
jgi:hypothetical protein